MTKIKVLWLSNVKISADKTTSSGGWVTEMFKALSNASDYEISNLFLTREKKNPSVTYWKFEAMGSAVEKNHVMLR